jgi:hypothetical protein
MKRTASDWDWEKKPKRVDKGTNRVNKHRKSIYNMLSEYEERSEDSDSDSSDMLHSYDGNFNYEKRR